MLSLIIGIFTICLLIILWRWIKMHNIVVEGIDTSLANQGAKPGSTEKKLYTGTFTGTFNGRMAIDDQYFYDKLFDDVVYYPNEYEGDYNLNDVKVTGWEKCKQECPGHCVEYNISGNSYCFNY